MLARPLLHVLHHDPEGGRGGTERHVRDLLDHQKGSVGVLFGRPEPGCSRPELVVEGSSARPRLIVLTPPRRPGVRSVYFRPRIAKIVRQALAQFAPHSLHIHHTSTLGIDWIAPRPAGIKSITLTLHDHHLVCPRGQRIQTDLTPCPTIDRPNCVSCVTPLLKQLAGGPARARAALSLFRPHSGRKWFEGLDQDLTAVLAEVDQFIAPSSSTASLHATHIDPDRMHTMPHALLNADAPSLARNANSVARVAFVGQALRTKGIEVFLRAAALADSPAHRFEIHGPLPPPPLGPSRKQLSRSPVSIEGSFDPARRAEVFASLDALVVPSLWPETFGYVVHEGLAAGLRVIASDCGAFGDLRGTLPADRLTLIPPGDPQALADAMKTCRPRPDQPPQPHAPALPTIAAYCSFLEGLYG